MIKYPQRWEKLKLTTMARFAEDEEELTPSQIVWDQKMGKLL